VYVNNVIATRWYLGLNCVYIPGLGYGIQEVYEGSPADIAGLEQGMIIRTANGRELETESVLNRVMAESAGVVSFDVVTGDGPRQQQFDVRMIEMSR
jgi:S1-C subfamily serine protease